MSIRVVAVSGGVDSVVLLHMLVTSGEKVVVAHVNHGIRDDSDDDARFVAGLAKLYGCEFEDTSLNLGSGASEDLARSKRYEFLLGVQQKYGGALVTAHHADDLVETVFMNIKRGTGWRGLCVLSRNNVDRPLLKLAKSQLYDYALKNHLEYVEDKTNRDLKYLRNSIRSELNGKLDDKTRDKFWSLRQKQIELRRMIDEEADSILKNSKYSRYFFTHIPAGVATEVLGHALLTELGVRPVEAQLERALIAIKAAKPGSEIHVGDGIFMRFTPRVFSVGML